MTLAVPTGRRPRCRTRSSLQCTYPARCAATCTRRPTPQLCQTLPQRRLCNQTARAVSMRRLMARARRLLRAPRCPHRAPGRGRHMLQGGCRRRGAAARYTQRALADCAAHAATAGARWSRGPAKHAPRARPAADECSGPCWATLAAWSSASRPRLGLVHILIDRAEVQGGAVGRCVDDLGAQAHGMWYMACGRMACGGGGAPALGASAPMPWSYHEQPQAAAWRLLHLCVTAPSTPGPPVTGRLTTRYSCATACAMGAGTCVADASCITRRRSLSMSCGRPQQVQARGVMAMAATQRVGHESWRQPPCVRAHLGRSPKSWWNSAARARARAAHTSVPSDAMQTCAPVR